MTSPYPLLTKEGKKGRYLLLCHCYCFHCKRRSYATPRWTICTSFHYRSFCHIFSCCINTNENYCESTILFFCPIHLYFFTTWLSKYFFEGAAIKWGTLTFRRLRILSEICYKLKSFAQCNLVLFRSNKLLRLWIRRTCFTNCKVRNRTKYEGNYPPPTTIVSSCLLLLMCCLWYVSYSGVSRIA